VDAVGRVLVDCGMLAGVVIIDIDSLYEDSDAAALVPTSGTALHKAGPSGGGGREMSLADLLDLISTSMLSSS